MSQLILDETEAQQGFSMFELVWAKILGWPWWPAKITQIPSQKCGNYRVQFLADTSHAYLPSDKLISFAQGRERHSTPKNQYRNFAKALGLANKIMEATAAAKEEPQSECTPREKLPVQQIQIINYSQQVSTEPKPQPQNKPQSPQDSQHREHAGETTRKPKNPIRRRDRAHRISNALQNEKQNKEVQQLLVRYKLDHITDRKPTTSTRNPPKKSKHITKNPLEQTPQSLAYIRTARILNKALSRKCISQQLRYKISTSLVNSLFAYRQKGIQGIQRALFHWIRTSDAETVCKGYNLWPVELKIDHFTDCS